MTKTKTIIFLILIISTGLFLRIVNINHAPPGVYPDEAVNGMSALTANKTNHYQWFYPSNNGREGLFINLIALSFKLLGVSVLALKLPSIFFGTLTIWGVYLLSSELFKSKQLGLISAFLLAVSFWSLNFSRIAFRAIATPTVLVFSFYFLFKGFRTKKWTDFALGGFIFGLGIHTYIAARITPLILVVGLFFALLSYKNFLKNYWKQLLTFIFFATLSAFPMFYIFFYAHPEYWQSRTSEISILNPAVNHGHIFSTFLKTFSLSLAKYNFWGDPNWRHNFPPYPILDPLTGIAFLFGIIYSILEFIKLILLRFTKKVRNPKLTIYATLLSWFFIMLVPEFMGVGGNPHALRSIGTLPVVFIFAALTFNYFLVQAKKYNFIFQKIVFSLIVLMLVFIGTFNSLKYFYFWAPRIETARAFESNLMNINYYLETLPPTEEIFAVLGNMQRVPVRLFNSSNPNFHDLHPNTIASIQPKNIQQTVIIFSNFQKNQIINYCQKRFPTLKLTQKKDKLGLTFWILKQ